MLPVLFKENEMKNPIERTGWFKTPKSAEELIDICKNMSNASEAQRMMIFTMNYCHWLVDQELDKHDPIKATIGDPQRI